MKQEPNSWTQYYEVSRIKNTELLRKKLLGVEREIQNKLQQKKSNISNICQQKRQQRRKSQSRPLNARTETQKRINTRSDKKGVP